MTSMILDGCDDSESTSHRMQLFPELQLLKRRFVNSNSKRDDNRIVWHLETKISETLSDYIIIGNLCGATKEEIDVILNGNVLTISFEMQIPFKLPVECFSMRSDFYVKRFSASHYIPSHVNKDDVQCMFEGHILLVRFGKIPNKVPEVKRLYISG